MRCPECNSYKKRHLGGESFECIDCGWFYADPEFGASLQHAKKHKYEDSIRCPHCQELTEGIGNNLEHLENLHNGQWFHPDCWIKYQGLQETLAVREEKFIKFLEQLAQVTCPICKEKEGFYLEANERYRFLPPLGVHWRCNYCNRYIDKHWLMSQSRGLKQPEGNIPL